jgi:hypothetical protein
MNSHAGSAMPYSLRRRSVGRSLFLAAVVSIVAVGIAATSTTTPPAYVFRAGAAASKITSPLGAGIVGGWADPPATDIHNQLHVRCLVLDDGTTRQTPPGLPPQDPVSYLSNQ